MICAAFYCKHGLYTGFNISGHADYAETGRDIVCAAVSSAALMAANTVTDVLDCTAGSREYEGELILTVTKSTESAQQVIEGLWIHLLALSGQYPERLCVFQTTVGSPKSRRSK